MTVSNLFLARRPSAVAPEWLERVTRGLAAHGAQGPLWRLLRSARSAAQREVLANYARDIERLRAGLTAGDTSAHADLDELAERVLASMRTRLRDHRQWGWLAKIDALWLAPNGSEYLDDADLDETMRVRMLANLDSFNRYIGSYECFFERVLPLLRTERPTRVLELAAGHGGFGLCMAQLCRERAVALDLTITDVRREYLELGREHARLLDLPAHFQAQDALNLRALQPGSFDVIVCSQSLHHFRPGQVAIMLSEAGRIAGSAVLFVDGMRSALNAAMATGLEYLLLRDRELAHDTLVSFRRFFVPEELALLAHLTPWGARCEVEWIPPGHCALEVRHPAPSPCTAASP